MRRNTDVIENERIASKGLLSLSLRRFLAGKSTQSDVNRRKRYSIEANSGSLRLTELIDTSRDATWGHLPKHSQGDLKRTQDKMSNRPASRLWEECQGNEAVHPVALRIR